MVYVCDRESAALASRRQPDATRTRGTFAAALELEALELGERAVELVDGVPLLQQLALICSMLPSVQDHHYI